MRDEVNEKYNVLVLGLDKNNPIYEAKSGSIIQFAMNQL